MNYCIFSSILRISTNLSLDKSAVSCNTTINKEMFSNTSYFTILAYPVLTTGPSDIAVREGEMACFNCGFNSSQVKFLALCNWSQNHNPVTESSKHEMIYMKLFGREEAVCQLCIYNVSSTDQGNYSCFLRYNDSVLEFNGRLNVSAVISDVGTAALMLETKYMFQDMYCLLYQCMYCSLSWLNIVLYFMGITLLILVTYWLLEDEESQVYEGDENISQNIAVPVVVTDSATLEADSTSNCNASSRSDDEENGTEHDGIGNVSQKRADTTTETDSDNTPRYSDESGDVEHGGRRPSDSARRQEDVCRGNKKYLKYRPHMQAIKDLVISKVDYMGDIASKLAQKLDKDMDQFCDGNGYIKLFKLWLNDSPKSWNDLLNLLKWCNKMQLMNELKTLLLRGEVMNQLLSRKPTMLSLKRHILGCIAPKFRDIGTAFQLPSDQLDIIEHDHPGECCRCCEEVLVKFLELRDASWNLLLDALREDFIQFDALASKIEKLLPVIVDEEDEMSNEDERDGHMDKAESEGLLEVDMSVLLDVIGIKCNSELKTKGWLLNLQELKFMLGDLSLGLTNEELCDVKRLECKPDERAKLLGQLIEKKKKRRSFNEMFSAYYESDRRPTTNKTTATTAADGRDEIKATLPLTKSSVKNKRYSRCIIKKYYYNTSNSPENYCTSDPLSLPRFQQKNNSYNYLQKFAKEIYNLVDVRTIWSHMISSSLLSTSVAESLIHQHYTNSEKQQLFVHAVLSLHEDSVERFLQCLQETSSEVPGHKDLLRILG